MGRLSVTVVAVLGLVLGTFAVPAAAAGPDTLPAGAQLTAGQRLTSANGSYVLDVQADGNVVVYAADRRVLWNSRTDAHAGAVLVMQDDGNLVVYSSQGSPLWNSGTWGNRGARLVMQDDGNLVLYRSDGSAAWFTGWDRGPIGTATGDTMTHGQKLDAGRSLTSANGNYTLTVQPDGNVVTYARDGRPLWNTGTWWAPGTWLTLQDDGNLVAYAPNGVAVWDSRTWGNPGSRLVIQDDGNLVLYRSDGSPAWYTGWDRGPFPVQVVPGASRQVITVAAPSASSTYAQLTAWELRATGWTAVLGPVTARVGASGVGSTREGLSRTPAGTYNLTQAFGRLADPGTRLAYRVIDGWDWWVSDTRSPLYNQHARCAPGTCPFDESAGENLLAQGPVYDHAVVFDYNRTNTPGAGSAFFLHVSNGAATAGCVAVDRASVTGLLRWLDPSAAPLIAIGVG